MFVNFYPKIEALQDPKDAKDRIALYFDLGKNIIGLLGGGLLIVGIAYTDRRVVNAEEALKNDRAKLDNDRAKLDIDREGLITDRFTKAIEQLGATRERLDGKTGREPNLEVRLGAIYALERLAKDSEKDHWKIMEVLTAYVRQNARRKKGTEQEDERKFLAGEQPRKSEDIQAIIAVLAHRNRTAAGEKRRELNLRSTDLRWMEFEGGNLDYFNLAEATLAHSKFFGGVSVNNVWAPFANFEVCTFTDDVSARDSNFSFCEMNDIRAGRVNFQNSKFIDTKLSRASLSEAVFDGADLGDALLEDAFLDGAKLSNALMLTQEQIDRSCHDQKMQLPDRLTNRATEERQQIFGKTGRDPGEAHLYTPPGHRDRREAFHNSIRTEWRASKDGVSDSMAAVPDPTKRSSRRVEGSLKPARKSSKRVKDRSRAVDGSS